MSDQNVDQDPLPEVEPVPDAPAPEPEPEPEQNEGSPEAMTKEAQDFAEGLITYRGIKYRHLADMPGGGGGYALVVRDVPNDEMPVTPVVIPILE